MQEGEERALAVWRRDSETLSLFLLVDEAVDKHVFGARYETARYAPADYKPPKISSPPPETAPEPARSETVPLAQVKSVGAAVRVWDVTFLRDEGEYEQKFVKLCFHFENLTDTRLIGVATRTEIKNSFGRTILKQVHENEVSVAPGEKQRNDTCWLYKENPFISGEPYDQMWKAATDGTAKIDVKIVKAIFDGGRVVSR